MTRYILAAERGADPCGGNGGVGRRLIAESGHPVLAKSDRLAEVSADSWIGAKAALGFPLTPLQRRMLDGQASYFEIFARTFTAGGVKPAAGGLAPQPDATALFLASLVKEVENV